MKCKCHYKLNSALILSENYFALDVSYTSLQRISVSSYYTLYGLISVQNTYTPRIKQLTHTLFIFINHLNCSQAEKSEMKTFKYIAFNFERVLTAELQIF